MPVETFGFINDLNPNNPPASDGLSQGDDHIRGIKQTLVNTFTGITGATDVTQDTLNDLQDGKVALAAGTSGAPSLAFSNDTDNGIYRPAEDKLGVSKDLQVDGRITGNGAKDPGEICWFPKPPPSLGVGGVTTGGPFQYLEADGSLWPVADYPALAEFYGTTFGGDGVTTFGVPNFKDTGRFPRSRTASVPAGTKQTSQNKAHSHTFTTDAGGAHTHGVFDPGHAHFYYNQAGGFATENVGQAGPVASMAVVDTLTSHSFTNITVTANGSVHAHSGTTNASGDTEARPESFVCVVCVKT